MPSLGRHGVSNIVHVQCRRRECDDRDQRATDDGEIRVESRRGGDGRDDGLGRTDDGVAGRDVPVLTHGHHGSPAARDEGAWSGPGDAGGGVDAAGPVWGDEVLVAAQRGAPVQHGRAALGGEPVLVRVAADARDSLEPEVEELRLVACLFEERHEERTQAAVDVQESLALESEFGEGGNVVDDAVWEVGGRANEKDSVAVYETRNRGNVNLVIRGRACDEVDLDAKIFACLAESCVCCIWKNPKTYTISLLETA